MFIWDNLRELITSSRPGGFILSCVHESLVLLGHFSVFPQEESEKNGLRRQFVVKLDDRGLLCMLR